MKNIKLLLMILILTSIQPFNVFAMPNNTSVNDVVITTPETETKNDDRQLDYQWTWLSDGLCVKYQSGTVENKKRETLEKHYSQGLIGHWYDASRGGLKVRDTYNGTWVRDENGIWSFQFDDYTIPVGLTKIDGVLYAFTGYGELKEGYEYWNGEKTGADGIVIENSPDFLAYLETQYLPECTTSKTE